MNRVNRGFRGVVYWFLFTTSILLYFVLITGFNPKGNGTGLKILNYIFINPVTPLVTLILLIIISISLSSKIKYSLKKRLASAGTKKILSYSTAIFIVVATFTILVTFYFAIGINLTFYEINRTYTLDVQNTYHVLFELGKVNDQSFFYILLSLIIVYSVLFFLVRAFFLSVYLDRITVNIHLKDGSIIEDKFIINPNIDGGMMIGDTYGKSAENKKLIPKSKIEMITFNRVGYSFGEKREKSKIINPKDISEEEHNEIIRKWRSSHKPKHSNF